MNLNDPATNQQIEEFHKRLDMMAFLYKQATAMIAADRLLRDLDSLYKPPRPRPDILRFGQQVLDRGREWLVHRQAHTRDRKRDVETETIIDFWEER